MDNEYVGECDVILMDHYEQEPIEQMAKMSSKVAKNINCDFFVGCTGSISILIQGLESGMNAKQEKEFLDKWYQITIQMIRKKNIFYHS